MITVTVDTRLLEDAQRLLADVQGGYPRAVYQAIKRTMTTGRAHIARAIGQVVNLKIAEIKAAIKVKNPSPQKLEGTLTLTRKPVPLIEYVPNRTKTNKGRGALKVQIRKNAPAEVIPKGFINAAHSPYIGVFQRVGVKRPLKTGKRAGKRREVISRQYGPTAVGVFANERGPDATTLAGSEAIDLSKEFQKNLVSQIERFLK